MDLSQLRALQDWFLKYELKTVPNVAEVASIGGMVRQYQIVLDPDRMRAFNLPHAKILDAVQKANQESGGSVLALGEAEYMVRATGYVKIFRNGQLKDTTGLDQFDVVPGNGTAPLRVGTRDFASYFQGAIGKVALYLRELTPQQIASHHTAMVA